MTTRDAATSKFSTWPRSVAEPTVPIFLALHGTTLLWIDRGAAPLQWLLVGVTFLLGMSGLAGWRSSVAIEFRAWMLVLVTWQLLYLGGGPATFFTLWYFLLSPAYSLALGNRISFVYPPAIGTAYLTVALFGADHLPTPVLWGRAGVMTATGLLVANISAMQRHGMENLVATKDEFIASVSHSLRTPLTAVVGFTAELSNHLTTMNQAEIEEFASVAHRQATEMSHIVEDLLVAARADIDHVSVVVETVDLRDAVEAVASEVFRIHDRPVSALAIFGEATAAADPTRVRHILRNLIVNALHHGGPHVEVRIGMGDGRTLIEVADDGTGVPDHEIPHLFEPYRRFQDSQGVTGSIGLGLFVSRTLAELMGGAVGYRRQSGETVFRLELPPSPVTETLSTEISAT